MFLTHIAFSLELIALGIGALLVLKCCKACTMASCCNKTVVTDPNTGTTKKCHKHFGFLKFIGYLIMILSVLGLICTAVSYTGYMAKHGMGDMYHNPDLIEAPADHQLEHVPADKVVVPVPAADLP